MSILTEDMKRVVREQKLGFYATVCPDGSPNLSPKGTTIVWDDDHLVFADLASPGTLANIKHNPSIEICIVDPFVRKGYRFKGSATILSEGSLFEEVLNTYKNGETGVRRLASTISRVVVVKVERALPLISPGYFPGITEEQMRSQWEGYWDAITQSYHARPTVDT